MVQITELCRGHGGKYNFEKHAKSKTKKHEKGSGTVQINKKVSDMFKNQTECDVTRLLANKGYATLYSKKIIK